MTDVLELFGEPTSASIDWKNLADQQSCPFLGRKCIKIRKSEPEVSIGTCSVSYGRKKRPMLICPFRLLENRKIFVDCLHLLSRHEPGNELHVVSEVSVPGGSVDYFLASARRGNVKDFVGIELQTMDTTGTVWPARQRFLEDIGAIGVRENIGRYRSYGMNWKMTAKTTLIQLHHKIQTFEAISKSLVLVTQDHLLEYLVRDFDFSHVRDSRRGDSMQFHSYHFSESGGKYSIELIGRSSTDAAGVAACLGLKAEPKVEFERIVQQVERKLSADTLFTI